MFDAKIRPLIDPPLNAVGRGLAKIGLTANMVTLLGLGFGLGAAYAVTVQHYDWALALVVVSRILDGLDGAVARATQKTAFGGYLDIVCDFIFYVSIPLAFGIADPVNLLPAVTLVAAFTITGISFLAFAVTAAEQGAETSAHGEKSFFYSTGLAEGGETIAFFLIMCLFPMHFATLAYVFAGLCVVTVLQRSVLARTSFRD
ncbi:CDP-alcohol phosphatidyltransferase family protein [Parasphingorhabdus cellanae]|uniref:CDP-alcohol phosphatidyltransferase family protein n=1 Tax=Parasphingorhabdus cellanae TaxID=2806553 RepID=A0ABX7T312_9SPHN|nr:CDP-alcohol phosphatidyltransferase family protein [Parasphingorhabdus cellanae]QTD55205.1 CDP-alcohol phosphatidyltransferase family protein [Parasphingorhabdus cellanae]